MLDIDIPGVLRCEAIDIVPYGVTDLDSGAEYESENVSSRFGAASHFAIHAWQRHFYMAFLPGGAPLCCLRFVYRTAPGVCRRWRWRAAVRARQGLACVRLHVRSVEHRLARRGHLERTGRVPQHGILSASAVALST